MAKNRNQNRSQKQSPAERGAQQARESSFESEVQQRASVVTPNDVARKGRQKRFGHN